VEFGETGRGPGMFVERLAYEFVRTYNVTVLKTCEKRSPSFSLFLAGFEPIERLIGRLAYRLVRVYSVQS